MSKEKRPVPAGTQTKSETRSGRAEIDAFVRHARAVATGRDAGHGRLILALDATMSRQPTWDLACDLQGEMFDAAARSGRLDVQLAYFRGFGECRSSRFVDSSAELKSLMVRIVCQAGVTQIGKVLAHALKENAAGRVHARVYIGDAMEENIDSLAAQAGELGVRGVPVFVFQEGHDGAAEAAFKSIARLSKGAWFRFDRSSADILARLLASIAIFATGGVKALESRGAQSDRLLIGRLRGEES